MTKAASQMVYVTPVGVRVTAASAGSAISVDVPHSFRAGHKFNRNPGIDNEFSAEAVQSVRATSITFCIGHFLCVRRRRGSQRTA